MLLLKLSWRNIWRNGRRTLLTAGTIAVALGLATWFLAIANGMYGRLLYEVLRMQAGNLTVEHVHHLEAPSIDLMLDDVPALRQRLAALDDVAQTKELVVGQAVASSGDGAVGVAIVGVQPSVEASMSPLLKRLVAGEYLADGDDRSIVVGAELARRLGLELGSKLVLSSNDVHGQLGQELVRVKGIFRTGSMDLDAYYVQVPIRFARRLFDMQPTQATQVGIILKNPQRQARALAAARRVLHGNEQVRVWPWQQILPELSTFMKVDKGSNYVLQVIILLMAMFTVFNTVLMAALERKREFAVMLALGTSPGRVRAQLLMETVLLGAIGATLGVLLGCCLAWATDGVSLQSFMKDGFEVGGFLVDPVLRAKLSLRITVGLGSVMVLLISLMSLVPMARLGKLRITDTFR